MDKGKMNDAGKSGGGAAGRDPSMVTSGDPRQDQPRGGGGETGPRPNGGGRITTGDRNAIDVTDKDARDLHDIEHGDSTP